MNKKLPNLSKELIELHKILTIVYKKGRKAGLKEALKPFVEIKDKGVSN